MVACMVFLKFLRYILCPANMDHQWTIIDTAIVYCYYYNLNDSYVIRNYSHDKANCHNKYLSSNSAIIVCSYLYKPKPFRHITLGSSKHT